MLWQVRAGAVPQPPPRLRSQNIARAPQLAELDRATTLAEKDYARFRIEPAELSSRRSWNSSTRTQARLALHW